MISTYLLPVAGTLILVSAYIVWESVWRQPRFSEQPLVALLTVAVCLVVFALIKMEPVTPEGIRFRLSSAVAIGMLLVLLIYMVGLLRHGVRGLGLIILPLTGIIFLLLPWLPDTPLAWIHTKSALESGHLLISLLSYAVLTLAAAHALMFLLLDRALKRKRISKLIRHLPSLHEIGTHMTAQVRWVVWMLGAGIALGLSWQWEESAHFSILNHKVLLSLFAWGLLLWLHVASKRSGWHRRRISIMVLISYGLLLLAYFGVRYIQSLTIHT
jgi:ABC-type uncharacterized transport system permease subunit